MGVENSYLYSLPYLIVLFLLLLFFFKGNALLESKKFIYIRIATFFTLVAFIGLRGHIYSDWSSYYPFFYNINPLWHFDLLTKSEQYSMEPGFILYTMIFKSVFSNYFVWVFFNVLVDLWILDKVFFRYTQHYVLAFIVFFVMNGLMIEFNLYRNSKAIMLFLLSLEYLKSRKFIQYFLMNLLGSFFHFSSFIFIPLYFIIHKKIPRFVVFLIFFFCNFIFIFQIKWINMFLGDIVSLLNIQMISEKTFVYSDSGTGVILSLGYFERLVSFVIFTIFYDKLVIRERMNIIFYNLFLFYFLCIFCFYEISVFSERFSFLFCLSYWFLYPNVYSCITRKSYRVVFLIIFISFAFLRVAVANKTMLSRYDNLLFGISSYEERSIEFDHYSDFIDSK